MTIENTKTWSIDYEQSGLDDLWVYKFDHEAIRDGKWHALREQSKASYRIAGERLQFVSPTTPIASAALKALLDHFAEIGPLNINGTVEVVIQRDADGLRMSDRTGKPTVHLQSLTGKDLCAADESLLKKELEDEK